MKTLIIGEQPFIQKQRQHIDEVSKDMEMEHIETNNLHKAFSILMKNKDFDFVLADFSMLGKDWRHTLKNLLDETGKAKLIFVSDTEDKEIVNYLMLSGCYGFIPASYSDKIFTFALSLMLHGCEYIPPAFLYNRQSKMNSPTDYRLPDGKFLTPRQIQVLNLLGRGLSNKQIAYDMSVSEATVKLHINALLKNLDVDNRTQAVINAQRLGFL